MATIVAMRNTGNTDLQNAVAEVSKSIGELKTEVRLYGTNPVSYTHLTPNTVILYLGVRL